MAPSSGERTVVMDFMIRSLESVCVGQFAKKIRSNSSFSRVSGSGAVNHGSQLSLSDSAPPSFSFKRITIVQWCKRSSIIATLTKLLSSEERFMFGNVSDSVIVGGAGSRVSENERYEREELKWGMRSVRSC